jgi:ABC-type branched-subunit amino acid transport system substrate-binding protein
VVKDLTLPFPNVEFQALLTEIASQKPDVVFAFFAGGGAVKFVKDYDAAGLKKSIPLMGSGFLTDGTLEAQGASRRVLTRRCTTATTSRRRATTPSATSTRWPTRCNPTSTPCRAMTRRRCWPRA